MLDPICERGRDDATHFLVLKAREQGSTLTSRESFQSMTYLQTPVVAAFEDFDLEVPRGERPQDGRREAHGGGKGRVEGGWDVEGRNVGGEER